MTSLSERPILKIEDLHVEFQQRWGRVKAVDGVSLDLNRGEILALVGESGSGKSMTALAVMGLEADAVVTGRIMLDGKDLRQASPVDLRAIRGRRIAMIFQNPRASLNPVLTIGRQISEVLTLHTTNTHDKIRSKVVDLLREVGLAEPDRQAKAFPHQLSGGMCQRVLIAMALACDPDVLIADEPTTALDVTVQKQVMDLLHALQTRRGTAILLITHDLGLVEVHADRAAVMYAGRIVEAGPVRPLLSGPAHPYTRDLLRAAPRLDGPQGRFDAIPGSPPDMSQRPRGCAYTPRCDRSIDRCQEDPPLVQAALGDTTFRCWRPLVETAA
jgi:oligopeptide/dipeptide ABC transporter ATP-binding protein